MLSHGTGEGVVVDQADPFEALEGILHLLVLEPRLQETALELPAAPLPYRQEPERALVAVLALAAADFPSARGHARTTPSRPCRP